MSALSAWGRPSQNDDIRALRRMLRLYQWLAVTGETLAAICTILLASVFIWGIMNINFENVIFYDGSERVCTMTDGDIHNVD